MRYFLILLVCCFATKLFAQKFFEGKISYVVSSPRDNQDAKLFAYFGNNKIRLKLFDANDLRSQDYVIVNLNSQKVYTVSPAAKTFRVIPLQKVRPVNAEVVNEIAGQKTTTVLPTARRTKGFFNLSLSAIPA